MNVLILEDNFIYRVALQKLLFLYGECHVAARCREAAEAFEMALNAGQSYDLVCLDILMPEFDGRAALRAMRAAEYKQGIFSGHGAKIVMVTGLNDMKHVMAAYSDLCDGYLVKPINQESLVKMLHDLKLLQTETTNHN